MMLGRVRRVARAARAPLAAAALILCAAAIAGAQAPADAPAPAAPQAAQSSLPVELSEELRLGVVDAATRLPLAALLGGVLALRPRRAPGPPRDPAVVETQIVLAIVGALIMLVVGASLARAFGIAGAANLIRYRANIQDPKDAVVMLSALAVGLASGVGLFGIAAVGTAFIVVILWAIEGFENRRVRTFLLTVKLGAKTPEQRARVERLLRAAKATFELRTTAEDELSYLVSARESLRTERLTAALGALAANGKAEIEWKEEPKVRPLVEKESA
jgi:hypothetical protein